MDYETRKDASRSRTPGSFRQSIRILLVARAVRQTFIAGSRCSLGIIDVFAEDELGPAGVRRSMDGDGRSVTCRKKSVRFGNVTSAPLARHIGRS